MSNENTSWGRLAIWCIHLTRGRTWDIRRRFPYRLQFLAEKSRQLRGGPCYMVARMQRPLQSLAETYRRHCVGWLRMQAFSQFDDFDVAPERRLA